MSGKKNRAAQSLTALRNSTLTPERRKEIASGAAKARWSMRNGTSIALSDPGTPAENVQPIKKKAKK